MIHESVIATTIYNEYTDEHFASVTMFCGWRMSSASTVIPEELLADDNALQEVYRSLMQQAELGSYVSPVEHHVDLQIETDIIVQHFCKANAKTSIQEKIPG